MRLGVLVMNHQFEGSFILAISVLCDTLLEALSKSRHTSQSFITKVLSYSWQKQEVELWSI